MKWGVQRWTCSAFDRSLQVGGRHRVSLNKEAEKIAEYYDFGDGELTCKIAGPKTFSYASSDLQSCTSTQWGQWVCISIARWRRDANVLRKRIIQDVVKQHCSIQWLRRSGFSTLGSWETVGRGSSTIVEDGDDSPTIGTADGCCFVREGRTMFLRLRGMGGLDLEVDEIGLAGASSEGIGNQRSSTTSAVR